METFKVVETFVSINGEGKKAGRLAMFIRLKGCNLNSLTATQHGPIKEMQDVNY